MQQPIWRASVQSIMSATLIVLFIFNMLFSNVKVMYQRISAVLLRILALRSVIDAATVGCMVDDQQNGILQMGSPIPFCHL